MEDFKMLKPEALTDNFFKSIGADWMLLTAGNCDSFNTMTAAWGGVGVIWHRSVCYIFVRHERYTFEFIERSNTFTICFFTDSQKKILRLCGTTSGRDVDKITQAGITPLETENGSIFFDEARLTIECKKIYYDDLDPENFLDPGINDFYKTEGYHRMYIGEIIACYKKIVD